MDKNELTQKLENLPRPELSSGTQQRQLKLYLMSARRSSWLGILLVTLPCLFLLGVILKYGFRIGLPAFSALEDAMAAMDHSFFGFVPPLVLVVGPLLALALNLLAILHVQFDRSSRELQIAVKMRFLNLLIAGVCLFILSIVFLYLVAENGLLSHS